MVISMRRFWLLFTLIILLSVTACGGTQTPTGASPAVETPTAGMRSRGTTESPGQRPTGGLPEVNQTPDFNHTPLPTNTPDPNVPAFDMLGLSKLTSFKSKLELTTEIGGTVIDQMKILTEQITNPRALRIVTTGTTSGDQADSELVLVGTKQWSNSDGMWLSNDLGEEEAAQMMTDLAVLTFEILYPGLVSSDFVFLADENLNGVAVRHYGLNLSPELAMGVAGEFDEVTTSQAEVWLSSDPNLPALAMRFAFYAEGTAQGSPARINILEEITEVNTAFTIAEPQPDEELPAGLPLYPGAEDFLPSGDFASFVVSVELASVVQFYADALTTAGWQQIATEELSGLLMETWMLDNKTAQLTYTTRDDGKIEVGIYVEVLE